MVLDISKRVRLSGEIEPSSVCAYDTVKYGNSDDGDELKYELWRSFDRLSSLSAPEIDDSREVALMVPERPINSKSKIYSDISRGLLSRVEVTVLGWAEHHNKLVDVDFAGVLLFDLHVCCSIA